ncbi:hypothetical protein EDD85DRAFT_147181 [Armillaria nabsnona]|nr:hypothetical protein EDD85DRAFT_147181 [Armillaria nabsnona]
MLLEPHERVKAVYFCSNQSTVIIDLVIAFTDWAERELEQLDILVENVGVATSEYKQVEGWEGTLPTSNLGPGLLAIHMIPKLLETARKYSVVPRQVIVASDVHYWTAMEKHVIAAPNILAKLSDKDLHKEVVNRQYFNGKLLNVPLTRSLQPVSRPCQRSS